MEVIARDLNELIEVMEENNIDSLADIDNAAMKPVTNYRSEIILLNNTGEAVFTQRANNNLAECKIQYDQEGQPYFQTGEENPKEYIKEFMKINYPGGAS